MNVLHLSTNGHLGGAGQAAWRLHRQLLELGVTSRFIACAEANSIPSPNGELREKSEKDDERAPLFRDIFIDSNRTAVSNTWFGSDLEGSDWSNHPAVREADVIHLHWVSGMVSAVHVAQLLASGKPILWTLHDMNPFTGGCHYSAGCEGFAQGCPSCPQLKVFSDQIPAAQLADKIILWSGGRIEIIALNRWMAALAKRAPVFSGRTVTTIPNGVDLHLFHPRHREQQRKKLNIQPDALVMLFVAESFSETRKGAAILASALHQLGELPQSANAINSGKLVLLTAGHGSFPSSGKLPLRHLGWCDEEDMARHYAAADLFILPSLEDNLPNTVVESLACGTPVIGFSVGGVPEMVSSGRTGWLIDRADPAALACGLAEVLEKRADLAAMRADCRHDAETKFDGSTNAAAVLLRYQTIAGNPAARNTPNPSTFPGPRLKEFLEKPNTLTLGRPPGQMLNQALRAGGEVLQHERNLWVARLADLQTNFQAVEADRSSRGQVIEAQGRKLADLEAAFDQRIKELSSLYDTVDSLKNERNLLKAQIADLTTNFTLAEKDRSDRGRAIEALGQKIVDLEHKLWSTEQDRDSRIKAVEEQSRRIIELEKLVWLTEQDRAAQVNRLQQLLATAEADRAERGHVIEKQGQRTAELERLVWLTEQDRDYWKKHSQQGSA